MGFGSLSAIQGAAAPDSNASTACIELKIGPYLIATTTSYGPRIVGVWRGESPEMLARLPEHLGIELPEGGTYRFHGGHRLWAAPEVPAVTYAQDDHRCEVATTANGLRITAPADTAGLTKEIRVGLEDDALVVDHQLINEGIEDVRIAAWGITQFQLGGTAVLPIGGALPSAGPQADRSVVVWPYTNLTDYRISWMDRAVLVDASPGPKLKIGSGPRPVRLGYLLDGYLFTKTIPAAGEGDYPDRGAVGQIFVNEHFCELESVGPVRTLSPGSSISIRERWEITECSDLPTACDRVMDRGSL